MVPEEGKLDCGQLAETVLRSDWNTQADESWQRRLRSMPLSARVSQVVTLPKSEEERRHFTTQPPPLLALAILGTPLLSQSVSFKMQSPI